MRRRFLTLFITMSVLIPVQSAVASPVSAEPIFTLPKLPGRPPPPKPVKSWKDCITGHC